MVQKDFVLDCLIVPLSFEITTFIGHVNRSMDDLSRFFFGLFCLGREIKYCYRLIAVSEVKPNSKQSCRPFCVIIRVDYSSLSNAFLYRVLSKLVKSKKLELDASLLAKQNRGSKSSRRQSRQV